MIVPQKYQELFPSILHHYGWWSAISISYKQPETL